MPISSDVSITNDCAERLLLLSSDPRALDGLSADDRRQLGGILKQINGALKVPLRDQLFPDTGPLRRELYPKHMEHFTAGRDYKERLFMAGNRIGKGLESHEEVLTPSGPVMIGDLRVGDFVIGMKGTPIKVLAVHQRGWQQLFRVTMTDGSGVVTDADHLWRVRKSRGRQTPRPWRLRSTADMFTTGRRYEVPDRPVIKHRGTSLPMKPYLLGCLLGDGGFTQGVTLTTMDDDVRDQCHGAVRDLHCKFTPVGRSGRATNYSITAAVRKTNAGGHPIPNPVVEILSRLGLHRLKSSEKFVPRQYLTATPRSRLELLRGLMDTDGTVDSSGTRSFSSASPQLARDVQGLAHSLGMNSSLRQKKGLYHGKRHLSWRVIIHCGGPALFRCARKASLEAERWRPQRRLRVKTITSVPVGCSVCIRVDAEDGIFLTGQCIPTHNTYAGGYEFGNVSTGWYPPWWDGWRTTEPGSFLVGSKTTRLIKRITQYTLFGRTLRDERGKFYVSGTGMIPFGAIVMGSAIFNPAAAGTLSEIQVKYKDSAFETSLFEFASYDQGRALFEGTAQTGVWFDEEGDIELYSQALVRTMTTDGKVVTTFTPLDGMTEVVLSFMPAEFNPPPIDERDELDIMGESRGIDFH